MSSPFATASPPAATISSTTSRAGPASSPVPSRATPRSLTTTRAPSRANASACSRPMPRAAPVTMTIRPSQMPVTGANPTGGLPEPTMRRARSGGWCDGVDDVVLGRARSLGSRPRFGSAEEETLRKVAVELLQAARLFRCLDAFGDDLELEAVPEIDDAAHERVGFLAIAEPGHEAAVDLQLVDRQRA